MTDRVLSKIEKVWKSYLGWLLRLDVLQCWVRGF